MKPKKSDSVNGRKGGIATLEKYGKEYYSKIASKGGKTVSNNRTHMAEIGRKGGEANARRWALKKAAGIAIVPPTELNEPAGPAI